MLDYSSLSKKWEGVIVEGVGKSNEREDTKRPDAGYHEESISED